MKQKEIIRLKTIRCVDGVRELWGSHLHYAVIHGLTHPKFKLRNGDEESDAGYSSRKVMKVPWGWKTEEDSRSRMWEWVLRPKTSRYGTRS